MKRALFSLALILGVVALLPSAASAVTFSFSKGHLTAAALPGEQNTLQAWTSKGAGGVQWVEVRDLRPNKAQAAIDERCEFVLAQGQLRGVRCKLTAVKKIALAAGDGNDTAGAWLYRIPVEVNGGKGADKLMGGHGNDLLKGGPGDDTLTGDTTNLAGTVTPCVAAPPKDGVGQSACPLDGPAGAASDELDGGAGNDVVIGQHGEDLLTGGPGADTFKGGHGFDLLDYRSSPAAVKVELGVQLASIGTQGEGDKTWSDTEGVLGSPYDDGLAGSQAGNLLAGGGGNDWLAGGPAGDLVAGGPGNDTVIGDGGADRLEGGDGSDQMLAKDGLADVAVDCGEGTEVPVVDPEDPLVNCERRGLGEQPLQPDTYEPPITLRLPPPILTIRPPQS